MSTELEAAPPAGQPGESAPPQPAEAEQKPAHGQDEAGAGQQGEGESAADGEPKPTPKGVQKRLDEWRKQASEAQRFNERLLGLLEAQAARGVPVPKVEAPDGPPRREQYENDEQYLDARTSYQVARQLEALGARAEQAKAQQQAAERQAAWDAKVATAAEKYEDFADVALSESLRISDPMADAIRKSENGPDIAYHLGKHPAEARRIAQLDPIDQILAIGRLGEKFATTAPPARQASKAAAPIEPVGGGRSSGTGDLGSKSQREYEAERAKQGAWWAKR